MGFFKSNKENVMNVIEKNKIMEARVKELVGEIERIGTKVRNMKAPKGGRRRSSETNEKQMLKEDNARLRSKIMKEKEKRGRVEEEIKAVKELMALKLKASNN